jgi:CHASE2 domain-containing sensor protein
MALDIRRIRSFLQELFKAYRGRPMALTILLAMGMANLLGEWPAGFPQPSGFKALETYAAMPFQRGRQLLFDSYQSFFPRQPQSQPVTIVAIDEASLARVGQWPWPRNRLAGLVDAINALKPLAIGLDIYMPEPDQTSPDKLARNLPKGSEGLARALMALPSHETVLARALSAAPSVLGAAAFDHKAFTTSSELQTVPIVVHGDNPLPFVRRFDNVLASLPELQSAAHGQAVLSVALEQGVVRRIPLVMGLGEKLVPGLALEMLRLATDSSAIEVFSGPFGIREIGVADVKVPVQPGGDIWLHFAHGESTIARYVSALDILQGKVDPERIEGKLVLIGLTGAGLNDMRTTALGELVPGIEIQAQLIESIVDGRFLQRPGWMKWAESGFILVVGLWMVWYIPRTDSRFATFLRNVPTASAPLGILLNLLIAGG